MILWWEKRRIVFNAILIPFSIFLCIQFWDYPLRKIVGSKWIILDTIQYYFILNLLFTTPWLWSVFLFYTKKVYPLDSKRRWIVFVLITTGAIFITNLFHVFQFDVLFAY